MTSNPSRDRPWRPPLRLEAETWQRGTAIVYLFAASLQRAFAGGLRLDRTVPLCCPRRCVWKGGASLLVAATLERARIAGAQQLLPPTVVPAEAALIPMVGLRGKTSGPTIC
jgi:hypothetical protein